MTRDEQLAWERRAGRFAAVAAFASGFLGLANLALTTTVQTKRTVNDDVERLILTHDYPHQVVAAAIVQALSVALLAVVLTYLYRATRYRRPETPRAASRLALIAPPFAAVMMVVTAVVQLHAADRVVAKLPLAPKAAKHLATHETTTGGAQTAGLVGLVALLAVATAIGLISINARRAGLLSGFMGILGVIGGALLVIGLFGPPLPEYFWVTALGLLFLDRWPGQHGRGPAWETGEAIEWPSAAQLRAEQVAERGLSEDRDAEPEPEGDEGDYEYEEEAAGEDGAPAAAPHPRSKKRKRKRRR